MSKMNHNNNNNNLHILRPRINALLEHAVHSRFVVVCAGAGFGKTQAVHNFLDQSNCRNVWFPVSDLDNIPSRFWEHFTSVVKSHKPRLGAGIERMGFPETLKDFDAFLAAFTSYLYQDNQFVVFVFDDVHLISEPLIKKFLSNLIEARLENSSFIMISREWPIPGMEITLTPQVICRNDLRFDREETVRLFADAGVPLAEEEALETWEYVSGWPIALSLAAANLHHRGEDSKDAKIVPLSRTKPLLFKVFETEIFSQYAAAEQELVIKLSLLDSFPRELVEAVTGEKHWELSQLLEGNQFIKYDAQEARFYFHPLYKEFLKDKRLGVKADDLRATYRTAAEWCRKNAHFYDAVNYFRHCGLDEEVWATILMFPAGRRSKTEADFLIGEIRALPAELVEREPMTRIILAVLLVNNLRFIEALDVINEVRQKLEQQPSSEEQQKLLGECYVARGLIALGMESDGFTEYFAKAARLIPEGSQRWGRKLLLVDFGPGLNLHSTSPGALTASLEAFKRGVPDIIKVLHGAGQGLDFLCQCEYFFLRGEIKQALEPAYQALYAANSAEQYDIVGNALFILIRCYIWMGDYKNIVDTLEHVSRYERNKASAHLGIWDIIKSWLYTEMEDSIRVAGWIRNAVQYGYPPISIDRPLLIRSRGLVVEKRTAEGLALLQQYKSLAEHKKAAVSNMYIELDGAVLHYINGDVERAITSLTTAWRLAKDNDIVAPFIEHGGRMRSLIDRVMNSGQQEIPTEWLAGIQARASTYAKRHTYLVACYQKDQGGRKKEYSLSRREAEMLTHLSQGLTRDEISACMNLSVNTVKSMLKQIFAKLGAVNSVDAVRIALMYQLI